MIKKIITTPESHFCQKKQFPEKPKRPSVSTLCMDRSKPVPIGARENAVWKNGNYEFLTHPALCRMVKIRIAGYFGICFTI